MIRNRALLFAVALAGALMLAALVDHPTAVRGTLAPASSAGRMPGDLVPGAPVNRPTETPGLRVLRSDTTGVTLELVIDPATLEITGATGGDCSVLSLPDHTVEGRPGWPALPARIVMLGVPPAAELAVAVLESESVLRPGAHDVCPASTPRVEPALPEPHLAPDTVLQRSATAYVLQSFWPQQAAEAASTGYLRDMRVAQVTLRPVQVVPATGQLRVATRLLVRVQFAPGGAAPAAASAETSVADPAFEPLLAQALLNYDTARAWRRAPQATQSLQTVQQTLAGPSVRIEVDQDGIHAVTPAGLEAAGVATATIDPGTFRLRSQGQEIAIDVIGAGDGVFSGEDVLLFYGEPIDTRFTGTNVYWLTWGEAPGVSMDTRNGTPSGAATTPTSHTTTARWEQNIYYLMSTPSGAAGDHWVGPYIYTTLDPVFYTATLTLDQVAAAPFSATLRGLINGPSQYSVSPDHHTRVYLNGHLVDDAWWDGWRDYQFQQSVPHTYLVEGENTITLELPFDLGDEVLADRAFINWYEIDYQRTYTATNDHLAFGVDLPGTWDVRVSGFATDTLAVYDVTSPTRPVKITGIAVAPSAGGYSLTFRDVLTEAQRCVALAPAQRLSPAAMRLDAGSDWRSPAHGADYILITHGSFYTDVLPLAAYRESQGLRTAVVDVQDIYDEFSHGLFDPEAIRTFLAYAYANWTPPAPTYVVLVGDGHYDFRNYKNYGEINFIPPYLAYVDPWIGETAADNRYVCVSGDDILPDMHLGRLPARNSAQAAAMVAKILSYEQAPPPGDWSTKILFAADNADPGDPENNFPAHSDDVADHFVPEPYAVDKAYYQVSYSTAADTKAAIIGAINAGRLMVNYTGHGAIEFWASEKLFGRSDFGALTTTTRLPFFVPMTCYEGYYISPSSSTRDNSALAEAIVRATGKGAIASWSPTGLGLASGHGYLHAGLYDALLYNGIDQLGPATLRAKLHLYTTSTGHRELIDTYLLFGDPATRLPILKTDVVISKQIVNPAPRHLTYALVYTNTGPAMAHNVVITDLLPAALLTPSVVSSGPAITARTGTRFVWDVADLPPGGGGVITVTAPVDFDFEGPLSNTVSIATTASEATTSNNHSAAALDVAWNRVYLPAVLRDTLGR